MIVWWYLVDFKVKVGPPNTSKEPLFIPQDINEENKNSKKICWTEQRSLKCFAKCFSMIISSWCQITRQKLKILTNYPDI